MSPLSDGELAAIEARAEALLSGAVRYTNLYSHAEPAEVLRLVAEVRRLRGVVIEIADEIDLQREAGVSR